MIATVAFLFRLCLRCSWFFSVRAYEFMCETLVLCCVVLKLRGTTVAKLPRTRHSRKLPSRRSERPKTARVCLSSRQHYDSRKQPFSLKRATRIPLHDTKKRFFTFLRVLVGIYISRSVLRCPSCSSLLLSAFRRYFFIRCSP